MKMLFAISIALQFIVKFVVTFNYEKPIPAKLWSENCKKNSHVLNDCNWCWCDRTHQYKCDARVCGQVDMFGHFNDAIREIDVGMEGRGRWRTTDTACTPGVYYRRGSVLCLCNEDGYWPNPVCRDIFRILHSVEVTRGIEVTQKCEPTKLYLVSCNVCFCPSTGLLNLDFCTKLTCSNQDPVLNTTKITEVKRETDVDLEVYATCNATKKYSLGCQTCICLRNNRLLCDNCTSTVDTKAYKQTNVTFCGKYRIGEIFQDNCNLCFCDEKSSTYCTVRRCLRQFPIDKLTEVSSNVFVEPPIEDHQCKPGTKYIKDCNICYCQIQNGRKVFSCTLKKCSLKNNIKLMENDCVNGTTYTKNCLICRCDVSDVKVETCAVDERCTRPPKKLEADIRGSEISHGFCKPLHVYEFDCNTCQCGADGNILKCTTHYCQSQDPVIVDLVPIKTKYPEPCPRGTSYKLDCNVCFCLDNGNAICTTTDCEKKYNNY